MSLNVEHYQMLAEGSGISPEIIEARGYYTESVKARLAERGFGRLQQLTPSLVLPLWHPNRSNGTYQIRPDEPRRDAQGKPRKYEFPSGGRACLDVTPLPWVYEGLRDPSIPLVFTEGTKKVDALASKGILGVGAIGVWNWRGTNDDGGKMLLADMEDIAWNGRPVFIAYDSDVMEKEAVYKAMVRLSGVLENRDAHVRYIYLPPTWDGHKVGLDDFFVAGGTPEQLFALAEPHLRPLPASAKTKGGSDLELATRLTNDFTGRLAFDPVSTAWREYSGHVWEPVSDDVMLNRVAEALGEILGGCSTARATAVMRLLRGRCAKEFSQTHRSLLPLVNGVLDIAAGELHEHGPEYGFTHCLPYGHDPEATCPTIDAWLRESVLGDEDLYQVLVAFARATLLGCADLQVFLECYGPGGSGKTTYLNLLRALVGAYNTVRSDVSTLDDRFQSARFYQKRLVFLPDQEGYTGKVKMLKNITGQDPVPYEDKYVKQGEDFVYGGMVILTANQLLQTPDNTSGWFRRRLAVPFVNRPSARRRLLDLTYDGPEGEFASELPGLLNLVLAMPEEEMRRVLRAYGEGSATMRAQQLEAMLDTNMVARWAEAEVVYKEGSQLQCGIKPRPCEIMPSGLYPSYYGFCDDHKHPPLSVKRFVKDFEALCEMLENGVVPKKVHNKKVYDGVALREDAGSGTSFVTREVW